MIDIVINEKPTEYKQKIYQGDRWRYSSMTDVKFVNKEHIIAAHRYACKLYSIHLLENTYDIIDCLILNYKRKPYQTESFVISNNKIYMLSYSNILTIICILPNFKLAQTSILQLTQEYIPFHGIALHNDFIYMTPSQNTIGTEYIISLNTLNGQLKPIHTLGDDLRVKSIAFLPDDSIVVVVNYKENTSMLEKGHVFNGSIRLYTNNFVLLDSIEVSSTHFDDVIQKDNVFYATGANLDGGFIYKGQVEDQKITSLNAYQVNDFPHGIDILDNKLAYTSYTTSGIHIIDKGSLINPAFTLR